MIANTNGVKGTDENTYFNRSDLRSDFALETKSEKEITLLRHAALVHNVSETKRKLRRKRG